MPPGAARPARPPCGARPRRGRGAWRSPLGVQLEDISPGHQHIDLIYLARPVPRAGPPAPDGQSPPPGLRAEAHNPEGRPGWFTPTDWRALPVSAEVDRWATAAVDACA